MSSNSTAPRYSLSFTTGGILGREAAILAPVYMELHDWVRVRDVAVVENLLQARTHSIGRPSRARDHHATVGPHRQ